MAFCFVPKKGPLSTSMMVEEKVGRLHCRPYFVPSWQDRIVVILPLFLSPGPTNSWLGLGNDGSQSQGFPSNYLASPNRGSTPPLFRILQDGAPEA